MGPREAVGYVRVSTAEQATGGLGLDAQRAALEEACRARGLELLEVHSDAGVSSVASSRPGLDAALAAVEASPGRVLVVAKLDRLARSLVAYSGLIERARVGRWQLLALDAPDTVTPQGEALQGMVAIFAQLERRLIGQRTRDALAAARARGVRLGRPPEVSSELEERIVSLYRRRRLSANAIARLLTAEDVPAPGGRGWNSQCVCRALRRRGVVLRPGRRRSTGRAPGAHHPTPPGGRAATRRDGARRAA